MTIESITEEYKLRNNLTELTTYDVKLINSIKKLREGYENELSKRKCSIFLKEPIVVSVFDKNNKEKETSKNNEKTCSSICQAIQMNGKACTAKTKDGSTFCGRHIKK